MRRRLSHWLIPVFLAGLTAALCGLNAHRTARADDLPKLAESEDRAVEALIPYLFGADDPLRVELKKLQFDEVLPADKWAEYSTEDLVRVAAQMAKNAEPRDGDRRLLATLSAALAREFDPLASGTDPHLKPFVDLGRADRAILEFIDPSSRINVRLQPLPPPRVPVRFKPLAAGQAPLALAPEVEKAVSSLATFVDRANPLGTPVAFFEKYFGVRPPAKVLEMMAREKGHVSAVIRRRLARLTPMEQRAKIKSIIGDLTGRDGTIDYWVLAAEPSLAEYLPPPPSEGPKGPSRPPRDPYPGPSRTQAAKEWISAMDGVYKEPVPGIARPEARARSFGEMGTKVRKFGGGVFGSPVNGDRLPKGLKRVRFEPDAEEPAIGRLIMSFDGGKEVTWNGVLTEDAYAAYALVFAEQSKGRGWQHGDGIGIIGLVDEFEPYYDFGSTGIRQLSMCTVILHPALVDTELGYAAIVTDALPSSGRVTLLRGAEKAGGLAARNRMGALLADLARRPNQTYVMTDVPVALITENGRLKVTADPTMDGRYKALPGRLTDFPEPLLRASFLELRLQTKPNAKEPSQRYDREFAATFYRHVPLLTAASHDIYRMNRFAAVLAVFRWARQPGVSCEGMPARPQTGVRTPDTLARTRVINGVWPTDEVIRPVRDLSGEECVRDAISRIGDRMARLTRDVKGLKKHVEALDKDNLVIFDRLARVRRRPILIGQLSVGSLIEYHRRQKGLRDWSAKLVPRGLPAELHAAFQYWLELRALRVALGGWLPGK
jgi:hypothetical protein